MSEWKKVGGGIDGEETQDDVMWDRTAMPELIGIFDSVRTNVGDNNSNIYTFIVKGAKLSVWGGIVLDDRLSMVEKGWDVKIVYKGKPEGKRYNDYDVFIK